MPCRPDLAGHLQGAQYFQAQLPLLSSNAAITYVFNYDNVLPGAAYLLAEATGFKNPSYVAPVLACSVSCVQITVPTCMNAGNAAGVERHAAALPQLR